MCRLYIGEHIQGWRQMEKWSKSKDTEFPVFNNEENFDHDMDAFLEKDFDGFSPVTTFEPTQAFDPIQDIQETEDPYYDDVPENITYPSQDNYLDDQYSDNDFDQEFYTEAGGEGSSKKVSPAIILLIIGILTSVFLILLMLFNNNDSQETATATTTTIESSSQDPEAAEQEIVLETTSTSNETTTTTEAKSETLIEKPVLNIESNEEPESPGPVADNGKLTVWQDDFDTLDSNVWATRDVSNYGHDSENQCYMKDNVSIKNGVLIITAKKQNVACEGGPKQYTSGQIYSKGINFKPGQAIEFRVKLTPADDTNQAGLFPAVWSSGWAGDWPEGGELDFLEVMTGPNPTRPFFSMHFVEPDGSKGIRNKGYQINKNFTDDWHTIRTEYREGGQIYWYLDGVEAFSVTEYETIQGFPAPFDQTIDEIKIQLALGGKPGPLDDRALGENGATFAVDYIKIFNL